MKSIALPLETEQLKKASHWIYANMLYCSPLSSIAALNEMKNAAALLIGRPDIFRHKVKYNVNDAIRKGEQKKAQIMAYQYDRKDFDDFTDNIIDVTEADVTKLRELVRGGLGQDGVAEAELVAWVVTAHLLLCIAVKHYDVLIERANREANVDIVSRRMRVINYRSDFQDFCMKGVRDTWRSVVESVNTAPAAVLRNDILDQLNDIAANYCNGKYLNQCVSLMPHTSLFSDMRAKDDGDKFEADQTILS